MKKTKQQKKRERRKKFEKNRNIQRAWESRERKRLIAKEFELQDKLEETIKEKNERKNTDN
jgi:hypothetical protein